MMGPLLFFRGATPTHWNLSVVAVAPADQEPQPLRPTAGAEVDAVELARHDSKVLWRYEFALPLDADGQGYRLGDGSWRVNLPRPGAELRINYSACNGVPFEDAAGEDPARNERWRHLAGEHARDPFHLMLQGGDQLYADTIWPEVPELRDWQDLPAEGRRARPFTETMRRHVDAYYFTRYVELWSQDDVAPLVASIPSLMMWDDHDIFDGWGSYEDEEQACPVYQGIWRSARRAFALFQLGAAPDSLPDGFADRAGSHFGYAYDLGRIGIIAPDLRSQRSIGRIMNEDAWRWLQASLEALSGCRHILLMSSVPVVHADLSLLERFTVLERLISRLSAIGGYRDDLRDQWNSLGHKEEWRRLAAHLAAFAAHSKVHVTVLSGEVHVAALGVIEGHDARVTQLTSSGIVSPVPPPPLMWLFELMGRHVMRVVPGVRARMVPLPGRKRRYLGRRNWLALDQRQDDRIDAAWWAEGEDQPIKVRAPLDPIERSRRSLRAFRHPIPEATD